MTDRTATIEIPRLADDGESARAHAAKVAYITMGAGRSLDKVRQRLGKSSAGYTRQLEEWSSRYGWQEAARRYDEGLTFITLQEAAAAYRRDLEEHRERYGKSGKALHAVAVEMLQQLRASAKGIEYTPAALSTIARALTVAADLEAHALRVADLLPKLDTGGQDD